MLSRSVGQRDEHYVGVWMRIGTKEVEETAEGEHREPQGFSPALRTPTFNTQVEKKQAKEVRMKRKKERNQESLVPWRPREEFHVDQSVSHGKH